MVWFRFICRACKFNRDNLVSSCQWHLLTTWSSGQQTQNKSEHPRCSILYLRRKLLRIEPLAFTLNLLAHCFPRVQHSPALDPLRSASSFSLRLLFPICCLSSDNQLALTSFFFFFFKSSGGWVKVKLITLARVTSHILSGDTSSFRIHYASGSSGYFVFCAPLWSLSLIFVVVPLRVFFSSYFFFFFSSLFFLFFLFFLFLSFFPLWSRLLACVCCACRIQCVGLALHCLLLPLQRYDVVSLCRSFVATEFVSLG